MIEKDEVIDILLNQEGENIDGTGIGYFDSNLNKFVINKWPVSSEKVINNKKYGFLDHFPHSGWTLIHQRKLSCGVKNVANCHPFLINNNFIGVHNGTYHQYEIPRLLMKDNIDFTSTTDSEVALHIIDKIGFERFTELNEFSGVFIGLDKNNNISISKTSKELTLHRYKDGRALIASELDFTKYKNSFIYSGYYKFNEFGKCVVNKEKKYKVPTSPYSNIVYAGKNNGSWQGGMYGGQFD